MNATQQPQVPHALPEEREALARVCFEQLDVDNSGALSASEFLVILQKLNPDTTWDAGDCSTINPHQPNLCCRLQCKSSTKRSK